MSRIKNLLLIVCIFFSGHARSQEPEEKIPWEEGVSLNWKDFKGKAPQNSEFQATTNTGITYAWGLRNEKGKQSLSYEVHSFFYPKLSWVLQVSKNKLLLQHEQTHFDITELHVRKLRKGLSEIGLNELQQPLRKILNDLYVSIEKERALMQKEFDRQTDHSLNKEAEIKWQKLVKEELFKLKGYRS